VAKIVEVEVRDAGSTNYPHDDNRDLTPVEGKEGRVSATGFAAPVDQPPNGSSASGRPLLRRAGVAVSLPGYVLLFGYLTSPLLRWADTVIPAVGNPNDVRYLVWNAAWVAHALLTNPTHLFDANINYPAPLQLTGSEHSLSNQIVFLPLYALTDNPLLALNALILLSYPAAALCMQLLLMRLGCAAAPSWVGGLLFALGPLQVPLKVEVRCLAFYLPLLALGLTCMHARRSSRIWIGAGVVLVLLCGCFSSYYFAVIICLTALLWVGIDLLDQRPVDWWFALQSVGLVTLSLVPLGLISMPYFARRALEWSGPSAGAQVDLTPTLAGRLSDALPMNIGLWQWGWALPYLVLGGSSIVLALATFRWMTPAQRRTVVRGLIFAIVGSFLLLYWLEITRLVPPLQFFRSSFRFLSLLGFGIALVQGGALDLVYRRAGPVLGAAAVMCVAAAGVFTMGSMLRASRLTPIRAQARRDAYRAVGNVALAAGGGPLLELPLLKQFGTLEADAMVGSTYHWLPLLNGFTSYQPPHRALFLATVARLPDRGAIEDLVDMTHLRWILLRPAIDWPHHRRGEFLKAIEASGLVSAQKLGAWVLLRVQRVPQHPEWFAALTRPSPGSTVLGTPLRQIPVDDLAGQWEIEGESPSEWPRGAVKTLRLRLTNIGKADWPAAAPPRVPLGGYRGPRPGQLVQPFVVRVTPRWRTASPDRRGENQPEQMPFVLWRDLPAGESLDQDVIVRAPGRAGSYELGFDLDQAGAAAFASVGRTIRIEVR
jgi:hypothetical protein